MNNDWYSVFSPFSVDAMREGEKGMKSENNTYSDARLRTIKCCRGHALYKNGAPGPAPD